MPHWQLRRQVGCRYGSVRSSTFPAPSAPSATRSPSREPSPSDTTRSPRTGPAAARSSEASRKPANAQTQTLAASAEHATTAAGTPAAKRASVAGSPPWKRYPRSSRVGGRSLYTCTRPSSPQESARPSRSPKSTPRTGARCGCHRAAQAKDRHSQSEAAHRQTSPSREPASISSPYAPRICDAHSLEAARADTDAACARESSWASAWEVPPNRIDPSRRPPRAKKRPSGRSAQEALARAGESGPLKNSHCRGPPMEGR
mmetsp:Transcript_8419/g.22869  ORF Transcript_8419/g.22869 Transcript_8419/m.22869 type:complete len:259 (+) Transcript_8419:189-965(+)